MIDIQSDDLGGNKINLRWENEGKTRKRNMADHSLLSI